MSMHRVPTDRGLLVGPGYAGFGGSAGYVGAGGISGAYADGPAPEPWQQGPSTLHDDRIHDAVLERLSNAALLDSRSVYVDVEAGVVTLRGRTQTRTQKHAAVALAQEVNGVKVVHDRLSVGRNWFEQLNDWASKLL